MALGAAPRALTRLVMGGGFALAGAGIAAGVAAAVALHRVVASQLSQVASFDPRIHALVSLVLLAAAALATWLPARRAVKVDPAIALRAE
jgi:putative ABC transport system permease protein